MAKVTLATQTTPTPNPPAGSVTVFVDSADSHTKQLDSAGNVIDLATAGSSAPVPLAIGDVGTSSVQLGSTLLFAGLFYTPASTTITKIGFGVGTQSGNMMLGVYDSTGTAVSREASFAVPAAGAQRKTLTASATVSGSFYMVVQLDNGTAALIVNNVASQAAGRTFQKTNTFGSGLPATLGVLTDSTPLVCLIGLTA